MGSGVKRCVLPICHEHRPGFHHRYTLTESVIEASEKRIRRAARERLRYPIATVTTDLLKRRADGELVKRPNVSLDVLRLRIMDPASRAPGAVLHRGEDFDVVDGRLDWGRGDVRGTAPKTGGVYSVTYYFHPRYIVESFPHAIRDTRIKKRAARPVFASLPVTSLAKLDTDTALSAGGFGA